jgi:hypothetical protein
MGKEDLSNQATPGCRTALSVVHRVFGIIKSLSDREPDGEIRS